MVRDLGKKVVAWTLVLLTFLPAGSARALSDELIHKFDNYQIYFYNPEQEDWDCVKREDGDDDDGTPGGSITLVGSTRLEKIWNYIVDLGISGLSDRPEAIAGILGNMQVESGFDPFIQNSGGCTGLIQWCKGSWNDGFFSYMRRFEKYYGKSNVAESIVSEGIVAELDFLFKNGSGGVTAAPFTAKLSAPTNKSGVAGARAYSDLFLVLVERPFDDEQKYSGTGPIEDPGVKAVADHTFYQAAAKRRAYAEEIYNKYGGSTGGTGSTEKEEVSNSVNYCDEDDEDDDEEEGENSPEAGDLISYIKSWVWPDYVKGRTNRKPAYADYMDSGKTSYHPCGGVDCGAFVSNIIRASGWDTSYPLGSTATQRTWLASHWKTVSVGSLKLGDVGIKSGHVILYIGNIPGYASNTASASDCNGVNKRAPSVGSSGENLNGYTWYRKK